MRYDITHVFPRKTAPFLGIILLILQYFHSPVLGAELEVATSRAGIVLRFDLDEGVHVYEDTVSVSAPSSPSLRIGKAVFPKGKSMLDPATGTRRLVHSGRFEVTIPIVDKGEASGPTKIEVGYQACNDSMCLLPVSREFEIDLDTVTATATEESRKDRKRSESPPRSGGPTKVWSGSTGGGLDTQDKPAREDDGWSSSLSLAGYYLAGVLLSFTPCIFPMIPVTISIIGARGEGAMRGFTRSLVYVFGLALTYALLGLAAAMSGGVIGSAMQNPFVLAMVAGLFFLLGLSMTDVIALPMPSLLQSRIAALAEWGFVGIFLTGMAAGLVASPCVTPVLAGVLLKIASEGNLPLGFMQLFVFAWGLGSVLILAGTFSSALTALPRAGDWMGDVKKTLGIMLMLASFYYLKGAVPLFAFSFILGTFLVILSVTVGVFDSLGEASGLYERLKKAAGIVAILTGSYLIVGTMVLKGFIIPPITGPSPNAGTSRYDTGLSARGWKPASEKALADARRAGRPVVLDFGAQWCAACIELEERTLSDARVIDALSPFVTLKVDMTRPTQAEEALRRKFRVVGFPTLVFIDGKGRVVENGTIVGFVEAADLLSKIESLKLDGSR